MNSILTVFTSYKTQVPSPPTGVSAVAGDAQAIVSWTAPTYNGGVPITSYTVTSSPGSFTASSATSPATVTGLTNGTAYTFTVVATNSVGNSVASSASSSVTPTATWVNSGVTTTFVGTTSGNQAGTGTNARISNPRGQVVASDGNIYLGTFGGNPIYKITLPNGVMTLLTSSTSGRADGTGTSASFSAPQGLCADNSGNIYIADSNNNLIRKMNISTLVVTTLAGGGATGNASGTSDGIGSNALFNFPNELCIDIPNNNLYIIDYTTNRVRKLDLSTNTVTTLAGSSSGRADAVGTNATFAGPRSIAYDGNGNLYVIDQNNNKIRKIVISTATVTTLAGGLSAGNTAGHADGTGTNATFSGPRGGKIAPDGNLYVTDTQGNHSIRKVTLSGVVTTIAGGGATGIASGTTDGTGTNALFFQPLGISFDSTGGMYVSDSGNNRIRKIT